MSEINNLRWFWYIVIFVVYYTFKTLIYRNFVKEKVSNVTHLFLISLLDSAVVIFCGYSILVKISSFKPLLDGILANTALMIAVIGFSLQSALKHIVAGSLVSYSGAFKIGDRITLRARDLTGYVENITLRHTIIRTYMNDRVIIPNSILNDEVIINNDLTERSASYPITFLIPVDSNIDRAIEILEEAIKSHEETINDKVEVLVSDVTVNGVVIKSFIWTQNIEDNFRVASDVRKATLKQLVSEGIYPAFYSSLRKENN